MMVADALWLLLPNGVHLLLLLLVLLVLPVQLARSRPRVAVNRRAPNRRWRLVLILLVAWAWITTTPAIANLLIRSLEGPVSTNATPPRNDATLILVLASGELALLTGGAPGATARLDAAGWERARAGVLLWRQTGGTLLFSGGPDGHTQASIATAMASVALDMGVPGSAIRLSASGSNTYEELRGASVQVRPWDGPRWIVTSAIHMPRAMRVAACLGLQLQPMRVGFRQIEDVRWWSWLPDPMAPMVFREALHEWVGMAFYRMNYGC